MPATANIKAGRAYVEVTADSSKLRRSRSGALRANARIPRALGLAGKKYRPLRGRPENVFRPVFSGVCENPG